MTRMKTTFPPRALYIRVFKRDRLLELWMQPAKGKPYELLQTYTVTAASGEIGPKRKEGDRQVPEGYYRIVGLNPNSRYHLSMRVNYPNASDKILSDPKHPGSDIFIHGKAVSIGCVAIGDEGIEHVYTLVEAVKNAGGDYPIVHLYPCKMDQAGYRSLFPNNVRIDADVARLWSELKVGYDLFEKERYLPKIKVNALGHYIVTSGVPKIKPAK
jgi:murein L,D-transpeptidase YafK